MAGHGGFDWSKKSLGREGVVPKNCPACSAELSRMGWEITEDEILCKKCNQRFRRNNEAHKMSGHSRYSRP